MAQTTIQGGFLGADLVSAQTALTSGLATTDEIIVSDAGVIKRMDTSVWAAATITFTNKSIDLGDNTLTGSVAEFNAALQSESFATLGGTETLVAKTLTTPTIASTGWTNALHAHAANNSGGTLNASILGAGTLPAARIAVDSIVEEKLDISNGPTDGQFLQAQAGGGGLTWAAASSSLTSAIQSHVDGGTYKCIALLECAYARAAFAESGNQSETNHLGMGWDVTVGSSNGTAAPSTVIRGGWAFTTHASANNTAGIETKNILDPADDWTIGCRVRIVAHADVQFFMGIAVNAGIAKRATTNAIGITALGTNGNFILFVDSGGSEGTDDSGVAHGGTEHALRMEIRSGGSTVEYFVDNTSYGSIASGLPTNTDMNINIGMNTGGSTAVTCHISDAYAYREI